MSGKQGKPIKPGSYYDANANELHEECAQAIGVTHWVCRRVDDFRDGLLPEGCSFAPCSKCRALIAYNPARKVDAPKVCMQCAGIEPEPWP